MGRLSNEKKNKLIRIEIARDRLEYNLKSGVIEESEIFNLTQVHSDYGIVKFHETFKNTKDILKEIYNCPFLLCDLKDISIELKKILPIFLEYRYDMEISELDYLYKQNYISKDELDKEKDMLEFCYYGSSLDGKEILKTGHVKNVLDNTIRCK